MLEQSSDEYFENRTRWWCERELVYILLLAALTYCVRLDALPLFGEEPRRALIAREMVESGDWLVPGTQRIFLPSRPPLQNWLIAFASYLTGSFDIWSVRLPSILSTTLLAVLIYGYLRLQFSRFASSSGSVAFLTMTLVMEFGRSAETEAVFSLFVASSMLLWHWGWMRKWSAMQMWSIGYACAALGMLTKGLQAPLYFVGATFLFLVVTGNWRALLTWSHLAGILVFVAVFGAWQGPFTWQRGLTDSWNIHFGDVAGRFVDRSWSIFLGHLVSYPCELLFVRLMPWSVLLLAFGSRRVRHMPAMQRETTVFMAICIAFSFVSVWLPPGSKARYYMPLFPCFAALIGIAIERLADLRRKAIPTVLWSNYVRAMAGVMVGSAVVVVTASVAAPQSLISLPGTGAVGYAAVSLCLAYVATTSLKRTNDFLPQGDVTVHMMQRGVFCVAAFLALVQICLVVTVQQRRCEDIAGQIQEIERQIPGDARLVSLGPVHHAFAFFYHEPIPVVALSDQDHFEDLDYFCLHTYGCDPPELPFEWTQMALISCDRFKGRTIPVDRVYVGRRSTIQQAGHTDSQIPRID